MSPTLDDTLTGPAAILAQNCIKKVEVLEYPELGMEVSGWLAGCVRICACVSIWLAVCACMCDSIGWLAGRLAG